MDWERILGSLEEFGVGAIEGYTAVQVAEMQAEADRYAPRPDSDRTRERTETNSGSVSDPMVFGMKQSTLFAGSVALLVVALLLRDR